MTPRPWISPGRPPWAPSWWVRAALGLARGALVVAVIVTDPIGSARSAAKTVQEFRRDGD